MACWRRGLTHQPFTLALTGSNPVHVIPWEFSSAGRASALQAECRRFDPVNSHSLCGAVVQMVRMPACHAGGRGFDSHLRRIRLDSSVGRAED